MILTPEIVFEAKREARRRFESMSFEDKIRIVERMRRDLEPLRRLREARDAATEIPQALASPAR